MLACGVQDLVYLNRILCKFIAAVGQHKTIHNIHCNISLFNSNFQTHLICLAWHKVDGYFPNYVIPRIFHKLLMILHSTRSCLNVTIWTNDKYIQSFRLLGINQMIGFNVRMISQISIGFLSQPISQWCSTSTSPNVLVTSDIA